MPLSNIAERYNRSQQVVFVVGVFKSVLQPHHHPMVDKLLIPQHLQHCRTLSIKAEDQRVSWKASHIDPSRDNKQEVFSRKNYQENESIRKIQIVLNSIASVSLKILVTQGMVLFRGILQYYDCLTIPRSQCSSPEVCLLMRDSKKN